MTNLASAAPQTAGKGGPAPPALGPAVLQRKCACGQTAVLREECEECAKRRGAVQRRAVDLRRTHAGAPPNPPRNGHDFSQVRVRTTPLAHVQPQLVVTSPDDHYEHEADRVADMV
jgi:hypothetical protein